MSREVKKGVTRNDVAARAGVSPAVVSFVLNNSNYVSSEKRRAVLAAIEELGYHPNVMAKGLRAQKSSNFAYVCDNIQEEIFSEVERLLFEKGFFLSLNYGRVDDSFIRMLVGSQFQGIFMFSNAFSAAQLNHIAGHDIPMVFYRTRSYDDLHPRIVSVAPDYYSGVAKSIDYLALKGHRRIGLVPPVKYRTKGLAGDDFRVKAYAHSLRKHRLPVEEAYICRNTQSVETICDDLFTMLVGMSVEKRVSALVTGNDYLAAQIVQYVKKLGFSVPGDIAVIGSDNLPLASITSPTLTTIDFAKKEVAHKAVDTLLALVKACLKADARYIDVAKVLEGGVYDDEAAYSMILESLTKEYPEHKALLPGFADDYMEHYEAFLEAQGVIDWD